MLASLLIRLMLMAAFSTGSGSFTNDFIDFGEPIAFKGRVYQYQTTQSSLDRHSTWDGKQELNIRLEQLYAMAGRAPFAGIGGIVPDVKQVVLKKFDEDHFYWVATVDFYEGHYDRRTPVIRGQRPLTTIEVPIHLDGKLIGARFSNAAPKNIDAPLDRALAEIEAAGGRIKRVANPKKGESLIYQVSFQGNPETTNQDLKPLVDVPNILRIDLDFTNVDDLSFIASQTELHWLDLEQTKVGDEDLKHLEKMAKMSILVLSGTHVTDEGLASVSGMSRLKHLRLNDTDITDNSLVHLEKLIQLRELELVNTRVTQSGVERLIEQLPDCRIQHDFGE